MYRRIRFLAAAVFLIFAPAHHAAATVVTKRRASADRFLDVRARTDAVVAFGGGGGAASTQRVKAGAAGNATKIEIGTASSFGPVYRWFRAAAPWACGGVAARTLFFESVDEDRRTGIRGSNTNVGQPFPYGFDAHSRLIFAWIALEVAGINFTAGILIAIGVVFVIWYLGRIIGKAVETGIETFDTDVLGTDVHIGQLDLNPFTGRMEINDLVVENPPFRGYSSDHLLKSKKILIDIDMGMLFLSLGREVHLEAIEFIGLDVVYEKSLRSSNVHDVLACVRKGRAEEAANRPKRPLASSAASVTPTKTEAAVGTTMACCCVRSHPEQKTAWCVHRVIMEDVGLLVTVTAGHGHGPRLAMGDVKYDDFMKTKQERLDRGESALPDIVRLILRTLLKTVATNVVGGEAVKMAKQICCCCHGFRPAPSPTPKHPFYKSLGVLRTMAQHVRLPALPGRGRTRGVAGSSTRTA